MINSPGICSFLFSQIFDNSGLIVINRHIYFESRENIIAFQEWAIKTFIRLTQTNHGPKRIKNEGIDIKIW